jgi:hypothetical protein
MVAGRGADRENMPHRLSRAARNVLLHGRYAHMGGRSLSQRAAKLILIAAAYSAAELLAEPGIGSTRALEIERWLKEQGLTFRSSTSPAAEVQTG